MLPRTLSETLSNVMGVPASTAVIFMRQLREAKLLSKSGRGRAAADMTPLDAARAMVAMAATPRPFHAVEAHDQFANTKLAQHSTGGLLDTLPETDGISAVAALIERYVNGQVDQHFKTTGVTWEARASAVDLVFMVTPPVSIQFRIVVNNQLVESRNYIQEGAVAPQADLREYRRLSGRTFMALADAFNAFMREDFLSA
ncbi:hypothetical protein OCUBac02_49560 (plasmid) [Bosea sp. ANAM02]|nr:hypothetical protein OCUBac02_49560 [Bosea sp. ANAM02]